MAGDIVCSAWLRRSREPCFFLIKNSKALLNDPSNGERELAKQPLFRRTARYIRMYRKKGMDRLFRKRRAQAVKAVGESLLADRQKPIFMPEITKIVMIFGIFQRRFVEIQKNVQGLYGFL